MIGRCFVILIPLITFLSIQANAMSLERQRVTAACQHCSIIHKRCSKIKPCTNCTTLGIKCMTLEKKARGRKKRNEPIKNLPTVFVDGNEQTISSPGAIAENATCSNPQDLDSAINTFEIKMPEFPENSETPIAQLFSASEDFSRMTSADFPFHYLPTFKWEEAAAQEELGEQEFSHDDSWTHYLNESYFEDS